MPRNIPDAYVRALVADMVTPPTPVDVEIQHVTQLAALTELLAETETSGDYVADPLVTETHLDEAQAVMPVLLRFMSAPPRGL
jgi:hypothetical protein